MDKYSLQLLDDANVSRPWSTKLAGMNGKDGNGESI